MRIEAERLMSLRHASSIAYARSIPGGMRRFKAQVRPGQAFWAEIRDRPAVYAPADAIAFIGGAASRHGLDRAAAWSIAALARRALPWHAKSGIEGLPDATCRLIHAASRLVRPRRIVRPTREQDATLRLAVLIDAHDGSEPIPIPEDLAVTLVSELAHRDLDGLHAFEEELRPSRPEIVAKRLSSGLLLLPDDELQSFLAVEIGSVLQDREPCSNHLLLRLFGEATRFLRAAVIHQPLTREYCLQAYRNDTFF